MSHGFDLAQAAVVAIDLQNDYRADGNWPVAGHDDVLANAARVIAGARAAGVPVVHVQAWKDPARGMGPASQEVVGRADWLGGIAGSRGAEICAEVAPAPGEHVVRKGFATGFRDTTLAQTLGDHAARHLMVFGVWSDMCVRGTVLDTVDLGYRVWLVNDASGSGTSYMHQCAVVDMANRLYGGWISGSDQASKALAGEAARPWRFTRPVAYTFTENSLAGHYAAI